jgi:hypothetical protein
METAFLLESSQQPQKPDPIKIDTTYYTNLTDQLLNAFYPKFCCNEKITKIDGKRNLVLRCPTYHRQYSKLAGSPLNHLKIERFAFSYLSAGGIFLAGFIGRESYSCR